MELSRFCFIGVTLREPRLVTLLFADEDLCKAEGLGVDVLLCSEPGSKGGDAVSWGASPGFPFTSTLNLLEALRFLSATAEGNNELCKASLPISLSSLWVFQREELINSCV